jgi:hypothetical protein
VLDLPTARVAVKEGWRCGAVTAAESAPPLDGFAVEGDACRDDCCR